SVLHIPVSRTGKPAQTAFRVSGFLSETQDSPRTIGRIACLAPIRLAKPAWDPYSMRVWPVVQKLPAPAAALRWQKVQAHPDQTGLLQTERNAANGMRPRRQANPSHSQQPQAWRRNSG